MQYNTVNTCVVLILQDPRIDPAANNNDALNRASQYGHAKIVELLCCSASADALQHG